MRNLNLKISMVLIGFLAVSGFNPARVWAEDTQAQSNRVSGESALQDRIERWKKLKEENPEKFQQMVAERKRQIKERFQKARQENPEQFQKMQNQVREGRRQRFEKMRRDNPEQFHQAMEQRFERFQEWKQKNPEKAQQFMDRHPGMAERMEQQRQNFKERRERRQEMQHLKQENPEAFRQKMQEKSGDVNGRPFQNNMPGQFQPGIARMNNGQREEFREARLQGNPGNRTEDVRGVREDFRRKQENRLEQQGNFQGQRDFDYAKNLPQEKPKFQPGQGQPNQRAPQNFQQQGKGEYQRPHAGGGMGSNQRKNPGAFQNSSQGGPSGGHNQGNFHHERPGPGGGMNRTKRDG